MGKKSCSTCVRNVHCHNKDKFKEGLVYACHIDLNDWDIARLNISPQITKHDLFIAAMLTREDLFDAKMIIQSADIMEEELEKTNHAQRRALREKIHDSKIED